MTSRRAPDPAAPVPDTRLVTRRHVVAIGFGAGFVAVAAGAATFAFASDGRDDVITVWQLAVEWKEPRGPSKKTSLRSSASRNAARYRFVRDEKTAHLLNLHVGSWAPPVPVEVRRELFEKLWKSASREWRNPWSGDVIELLDLRQVTGSRDEADKYHEELLAVAFSTASVATTTAAPPTTTAVPPTTAVPSTAAVPTTVPPTTAVPSTTAAPTTTTTTTTPAPTTTTPAPTTATPAPTTTTPASVVAPTTTDASPASPTTTVASPVGPTTTSASAAAPTPPRPTTTAPVPSTTSRAAAPSTTAAAPVAPTTTVAAGPRASTAPTTSMATDVGGIWERRFPRRVPAVSAAAAPSSSSGAPVAAARRAAAPAAGGFDASRWAVPLSATVAAAGLAGFLARRRHVEQLAADGAVHEEPPPT